MKKVALYCRVSSDDQKERETIENQVEILNTYIDMKENLTVYKQYLDDGISGTIPFENRTAGKELLEDASKGSFDCILVWKIDRFGRDTLTGLSTIETLRKLDIEIISITEPFDLNTPTGRFQFINYLNMAELERNNILDRMYLGATRAAKKGKWLGGIVPYGYRVDKDNFLEVYEDEATIIRKIFDLYVNEKMSSLAVAYYLNNIGVPSPSAGKSNSTGKWRANSIQRIITNSTYKGIHEYGKRGTRRKETILREVPSIVSVDVWDQAQLQKEKNSLESVRNTKNRVFLLSKLIKCSECGKTYYGITYPTRNDVYACSGKRGDNKKIFNIKCNNINLLAKDIEGAIWSQCKDILKDYESYIENIKKNSSGIKSSDKDISKLKSNLQSKQKEKNNILTLYRKGIIDEEDLESQLQEIKKEESNIKQLIRELEDREINNKSNNELLENTKELLKYYHERIENLSESEKSRVIKILIKDITVTKEVSNGELLPCLDVTYNLVKLDIDTVTRERVKFDIDKNGADCTHKNVYIIRRNSINIELKSLRLKNNMSIKELANCINVHPATISALEKNRITPPQLYYYTKIICDYYQVDFKIYMDHMKEATIKQRLEKIRAYTGSRNWSDVAKLFNVSEDSILTWLVNIPKCRINEINNRLKELKSGDSL